MALYDLKTLLSENSYPGRGIVIGKSADGKSALIAYFIMGRSENSRNRIFERFEGGMRTKAFDESKLSEPSLIIYNPYLKLGDTDIITNGDQTNTIYDFLKEGKTFEDALYTREYEPDFPNFTPRISGALYYGFAKNMFSYKLSILKSANGRPLCDRYFYNYTPEDGIGHFIHTYKCDGNPIPHSTASLKKWSYLTPPKNWQTFVGQILITITRFPCLSAKFPLTEAKRPKLLSIRINKEQKNERI